MVAASTGAPKVLRWKEELAGLRPLNGQIFSACAGYILTINLLFGMISLAAPLPLLFPPWFTQAAVWPIAGIAA